MNKVLKGLVAVAATAAMAVAGFAGASTATAEESTSAKCWNSAQQYHCWFRLQGKECGRH